MKNKIFWSEQNIYSSPQRVSLKVSSGVTESAYSLSSLVSYVFMKLIKSLNYESARRHDKNWLRLINESFIDASPFASILVSFSRH